MTQGVRLGVRLGVRSGVVAWRRGLICETLFTFRLRSVMFRRPDLQQIEFALEPKIGRLPSGTDRQFWKSIPGDVQVVETTSTVKTTST